MGHFVELILELLFGLAKDTPDKKPEIEYTDHFIVKHPRKKTLARICASFIIVAVFSFLWIFIKDETRYLFAILVSLGIILFALSLFAFSFKCDIDDTKISRSYFWLFQKKIKWQDILCVRVVEQTNEKSLIIALYNQVGKCVIDFNTDMENAWYIVKMAEQKELELKNEKDLTLKQLAHL
ncbi:MAG: hypothetical protein IKL21_03845 [Clostridia bacterium]|nr:hypothetical protein [Clostridia bacterium]